MVFKMYPDEDGMTIDRPGSIQACVFVQFEKETVFQDVAEDLNQVKQQSIVENE